MSNKGNQDHRDYNRRRNSDLESARRQLLDEQHEFRNYLLFFIYRLI